MIQDYVLHCLRVQSSQKKMKHANDAKIRVVFTISVTRYFFDSYVVSRILVNIPPLLML
jgi:hypothetical protein